MPNTYEDWHKNVAKKIIEIAGSRSVQAEVPHPWSITGTASNPLFNALIERFKTDRVAAITELRAAEIPEGPEKQKLKDIVAKATAKLQQAYVDAGLFLYRDNIPEFFIVDGDILKQQGNSNGMFTEFSGWEYLANYGVIIVAYHPQLPEILYHEGIYHELDHGAGKTMVAGKKIGEKTITDTSGKSREVPVVSTNPVVLGFKTMLTWTDGANDRGTMIEEVTATLAGHEYALNTDDPEIIVARNQFIQAFLMSLEPAVRDLYTGFSDEELYIAAKGEHVTQYYKYAQRIGEVLVRRAAALNQEAALRRLFKEVKINPGKKGAIFRLFIALFDTETARELLRNNTDARQPYGVLPLLSKLVEKYSN